jgi:hypothetical protein
MKKLLKRGLILVTIVIIVSIGVPTVKAAESKYISIKDYIKLLVEAMELEIDNAQEEPYIAAAIKSAIIIEDEFSDIGKPITRAECALLTNRADEVLHGKGVDTKIFTNIVNLDRISDLKKVNKKYQDAVVKIFGKGIIVGYSNGKCSQSRQFKGGSKISYSGAKIIIDKLINTKKRSVMSPDGQLTRTTNLPVNACEYDYILDSFPNDFYTMKFGYELSRSNAPFTLFDDYCPPVKLKDRPFTTGGYHGSITETREMLDKYLYSWCEKVEKNFYYRFNVDYRTIDSKWVKNFRNTYLIFNDADYDMEKTNHIKKYVSNMKKNHVIIKSSQISVEPSTLYLDNGYYLRVYVKFMVVNAKDMDGILMYADNYMPTIKEGKWHEGYYDIWINGYSSSFGEEFAVDSDVLNDTWAKECKIKLLKPAFNKKGDSDFPEGFYFFK